jgi:protein O-GlcNAc transferase
MTQSDLLKEASAALAAGRPADAKKVYLNQLAISPNSADAHHGLGTLLMHAGHLNEGLSYLYRALELAPGRGYHWLDFIKALSMSGRADEAHNVLAQGRLRGLSGPQVDRLESFMKSAATDLETAQKLLAEATHMERKGCNEDALGYYQQAFEIRPQDPVISLRMGDLLHALYRSEEAETAFNRVVNLDPESALGFIGLGMSLFSQGKMLEAAAAYRRAIALDTENPSAHALMGAVQDQMGEAEEAEREYRRTLSIKPDDAIANSNLLFMLAYRGDVPVQRYLQEARLWDLRMLTAAQREIARAKTFQRPESSGRRLRVGYVSGDFRQHAVAVFFEQILANRNTERSEVWLYSNNLHEDAVSERLKAMAVHWVSATSLSDQALCDRIADDAIDVLIDLSGHTAHNRLRVFASRAAPVQAHFLGYFASTGLREMDYLIADQALVPDESITHFSEVVWRLPRPWVSYAASDDAPMIRAMTGCNGRIQLGSFNSLGKLNDKTLALWAQILKVLPEAHLLLKAKELSEPTNCSRLVNKFGRLGVAADRIELVDATSTWREHMELYNRLDIALDPIASHSGVTTTCDALWMGVPLVTLAGGRFSQRQGVSILTALGQEDWIAQSEQAYINKVVQLASDVALRTDLRQTQRDRMNRSHLCDAKGLADALDDAYVAMFNQWHANPEDARVMKSTERAL